MARAKDQSPAEKLAAEIKANGVKRKKPEGPRYFFPENTLAKERERLGLKVNQAATGAGISSSTLAECEKGGNTNLAAALRIAMFYGKDVEKLFGNIHREEMRTQQSDGSTLIRSVEVAQNAIPTEPLPFEGGDEGDPE